MNDTTLVSDDDPTVDEAMQKAQEELPTFLGTLHTQKPGKHDDLGPFYVKLRPTIDGVTEGLWLIVVWWDETTHMQGLVTNEPEDIALNFRDRLQFEPDNICDWMFWNGSACQGAFMTRLHYQQQGLSEDEINDKLNATMLEQRSSFEASS